MKEEMPIPSIDRKGMAMRLNDIRLQVAFLAGTLMQSLEAQHCHESIALGAWNVGLKLCEEIGEIIDSLKG